MNSKQQNKRGANAPLIAKRQCLFDRVHWKDLWFIETAFENPIMSAVHVTLRACMCVCGYVWNCLIRRTGLCGQPGWNPLVNLSSLVLTHRLTFVSTRCYLAQHWAHGQRGQRLDRYPHLSPVHTGDKLPCAVRFEQTWEGATHKNWRTEFDDRVR